VATTALGVLALGCWLGACARGVSDDSGGDDDDDGSHVGGHAGGTFPGGSAPGGSTAGGSAPGGGSTGGSASGGGAPCSEDPCKLTLPQCGCASGEKCTLTGTNRICRDNGTDGEAQPCEGSPDSCVAGYICVHADDDPYSCHKFCATDADCAPPQSICFFDLGGAATLCSGACDPVGGSGCPTPGLKCEIGLDEGPPERFFTLCASEGTGTQGTACTGSGDCASGYTCVDTGTTTCAAWCEYSGTGYCAYGTCSPFTDPVMIGSTEYGGCL